MERVERALSHPRFFFDSLPASPSWGGFPPGWSGSGFVLSMSTRRMYGITDGHPGVNVRTTDEYPIFVAPLPIKNELQVLFCVTASSWCASVLNHLTNGLLFLITAILLY